MNIRKIKPGARVRVAPQGGSRGGLGTVVRAALPSRADVSMDDGRDFRCVAVASGFGPGGRFTLAEGGV